MRKNSESTRNGPKAWRHFQRSNAMSRGNRNSQFPSKNVFTKMAKSTFCCHSNPSDVNGLALPKVSPCCHLNPSHGPRITLPQNAYHSRIERSWREESTLRRHRSTAQIV